jgi:hypothetical protein
MLMSSMSKPSEPSKTHGGAPPPSWSSERCCARNPSYALPDYQTTSAALFKRAGKQFKRKHVERLVGRLETVITVPHEDLILCEAVIVFEAYAPPARTSPFLGLLACRPALECALVTAPTSRLARIMRPVLDDACWAAVMAHANAWLQCAVSGESPGRPGLSRDLAMWQLACAVCGLTKRRGPVRKRVGSDSVV